MPPKPDDLKIEDIIGIVIGVVGGTVLLIAIFIFFRGRRREQRLRQQIEKAANFTAAAHYRTKSIGTEDSEMGSSPRPSDNSPDSIISRFSEAPDSAVTELNPYNYRMRPELATIKSSSRVELIPDQKTLGRCGPHELEAGEVAMPMSAKVANHVQGENDSEAGSPVVEMKEVKI